MNLFIPCGAVVSLSSFIDLKNTWSDVRVRGGRTYDVELDIGTGGSFVEVTHNGALLRLRDGSYGANESISVVPDSAPNRRVYDELTTATFDYWLSHV